MERIADDPERRMHQRGWNVTAMDFSIMPPSQVQEKFGIPCHVGSLPAILK